MEPFTTKSCVGFEINLFVLEKRGASLGFSARRPQMWTIENPAHVPDGKETIAPQTQLPPSQLDPTLPDNGNTENKARKKTSCLCLNMAIEPQHWAFLDGTHVYSQAVWPPGPAHGFPRLCFPCLSGREGWFMASDPDILPRDGVWRCSAFSLLQQLQAVLASLRSKEGRCRTPTSCSFGKQAPVSGNIFFCTWSLLVCKTHPVGDHLKDKVIIPFYLPSLIYSPTPPSVHPSSIIQPSICSSTHLSIHYL